MLRGTTCPHRHRRGGDNLYLTDPPLAWGTPPLYGAPSPRIPPYYMSECQFRGYNPLYNDFKILEKNCSLSSPVYMRNAWE